ncbi:MAG: class I SAM-dependent methyltransferase, partial [Phycisphaerae bacterium]|nr:class I SAM-dependent methyltransferase [Phycisphaerae bacterium]
MTQSATQSDKEQLTALVYGDTFSLYDEQTFDEFVRPLYARLEANGIDTAVFGGKRCLDAGCGGGRGSILMAQCGAAEVVAADLSAKNIESTRRRAKQKGLSNVKVRQCSLLDLDLGDAEFDVVWCNGVLH